MEIFGCLRTDKSGLTKYSGEDKVLILSQSYYIVKNHL